MIINRNNYEEYFLLYADGELTLAEKQAVDAFTHQHPDLAEELKLLMDVVLPHEMAVMSGKDRLMKLAEWNENTPTPQQTALLMHLDGELPHTGNGTAKQYGAKRNPAERLGLFTTHEAFGTGCYHGR